MGTRGTYRNLLPALVAAFALSAATSSLSVQALAAAPASHQGQFKHTFRSHQQGYSGTASTATTATANDIYSNGGSVDKAPTVYLDFWGAEWQNGFTTGGYTSAQAQNYIQAFFTNVGGSPWLNTTAGYCQGVPTGTYFCGSTAQKVTNPLGQLKGVWTDGTASVPASPVDADIAAEAGRAVQHFGLDPNGIYFVFSPTGKSEAGFGSSWCGWHGYDSSVTSAPYAYIPYQPDAGGSCGVNFINKSNDSFGHGYFDGFSVVGGHEYGEAITDPFPNSGWLDSAGNENGDKCAWSGSSANISLAGNYFAVQPLWSNLQGGCAIGTLPNASSIGGALNSSPRATSWGGGRIDVVSVGTDNAVWHTWSTDGGQSYLWESLGGYATSAPSVTTWSAGRLDVVVRGGDGAIWHRCFDGSWHNWESVGGQVINGPASASWGAGRLDIVVRGTDNHVWHKSWNGSGWSGWQNLGGVLSASPGAVSSSLNNLELFARGTDNQLWHRWWNGSAWSAWSAFGGAPAGAPDASSPGAGREDVFIRGTDNQVWHRALLNGAWQPWSAAGGTWNADPAGAQLGGGNIDVYEAGLDGQLWQISLTNQ